MKKAIRHGAGFTLIELLVVMAIIGILAAVVMPRLNSARDLSVDALVKSNVGHVRSQAEILVGNLNDYSTVCDDGVVMAALGSAAEKSTGSPSDYVCNDDLAGWAAAVPLKVENQVGATSGIDYWCVDRSNRATVIDTNLLAGSITCS